MKHAILATALAAVSTLTADAALITWGTAQNITGDSDVSTAGTFIDAMNVNGLTTTVNGVVFTGVSAFGGSSGSLSLSNTDGGSSGNTSTPPFGALTSQYRELISGGSLGSSMWLTLSGLMIGETYELQFWSSMTAFPIPGGTLTATDGVNAVTLDSNVPGVSGGLGQYVLGTFIADSTAQVVTFTSNTGDGVLNGVQLRNVTPAFEPEPETPAAVPEPGTALAGVMLAGLLGVRRRRGSQV